jgi:putative salt-induced outer membrane protein YdiY
MSCFITFNTFAEQLNSQEWKTPTPVFKQDFDWLRLGSGEWLKGDIISMYKEELEFDSDELDTQFIDWDDVAELRSKGELSIRMDSGEIVEGYLVVLDSKLTIVKNGLSQNYPLNDLLSIALTGDNEIDLWAAYVNLGANFSSGNTEQFDLTLKMGAQRRSSVSRFKIDYLSNYSETDITDDTGAKESVVTADSLRLTSTYDWFYSQKIFFRLADFEYFSDELINLDKRISFGVALGYTVIDTNKTTWDVTIGPSYQSTTYLNVQAGEDKTETSGAISVGTAFEYEITKNIDFDLSYQAQVVNEESGGVIHHFESGVEVDLVGDLDLDVTFYLDRINEPKADEFGISPEKNDYRLTVSLGYDF